MNPTAKNNAGLSTLLAVLGEEAQQGLRTSHSNIACKCHRLDTAFLTSHSSIAFPHIACECGSAALANTDDLLSRAGVALSNAPSSAPASATEIVAKFASDTSRM